MLEASEARAVCDAVGEQPVAALHGALEVAEARAVAGIEAEDETVEEAAPVRGGAAEQAVHRGGEPDDFDEFGKHAAAALGFAIDADDAT